MIATAMLALTLIWSAGPDKFGVPNQLMITTFIVGLASFLIWITTNIIEIRENIISKN